MTDDPTSPVNDADLRKFFQNATGNITDDQLREYLRTTLTDDLMKKTMMAQIPDLMKQAENSGKSKEELRAYEQQITEYLSRPETIETARQGIMNDPKTLASMRAAMGNATPENMQAMKDALANSSKVAFFNAVVSGCNKGYLDAAFWGVTSGAQVATEVLGSTSRLAKFLNLGRATPGVAVAVGLIEGAFAANDFAHGRNEEGAKKLGGSIGGIAGTLAAGAATVGVLATAPAWVPIAVGAAIGTAAYFEGRAIGEGIYAVTQIHKIYADLDSQYQPDQTNFRNLKNQIAEILVQHPEMRAEFAAMGVKTTKVEGQQNWIRPEDFQEAMADPKIGGAVTAKVVNYVNQKKANYERIRDENDHWYESRYFCFTDKQANEQSKYELNKLWAREMQSALSEVDGYKGQGQARLTAKAKAQADLQKALEPFNKLDAGVKASIVASLEKNYPAYRTQNGDKAMDHDTYMMANEAAIASRPEVLKMFQDAETKIQFVAGKQIDEWKTTHGNAAQTEIDRQKDEFAKALRNESLNSPESFQSKVDHYKQLESRKVETEPETKPEARAAFTSQTTTSTTAATTQFVSTETPAPLPTTQAQAQSSGGIFSTLTNAFRAAAASDGNILEKVMTFLSALFTSAASGETKTPQTATPTARPIPPAYITQQRPVLV